MRAFVEKQNWFESRINDKIPGPANRPHEIDVGLSELGKFQIDPANPKPIVLQPFDKMAADESTGSADQGTFHHSLCPYCRRGTIPTRVFSLLFCYDQQQSLGGAVSPQPLDARTTIGRFRRMQTRHNLSAEHV